MKEAFLCLFATSKKPEIEILHTALQFPQETSHFFPFFVYKVNLSVTYSSKNKLLIYCRDQATKMCRCCTCHPQTPDTHPGKLPSNQYLLLREHHSSDRFTVNNKAHNHYIKPVRKMGSNSNNKVFREQDSPLI